MTSQTLQLLMAQINPTVGAIEANAEKIIHIINAEQAHHDLIIFPELVLTGYPLEDLLFRQELFERTEQSLQTIMNCVTDCHVIVGHPSFIDGQRYNSASVFQQGKRVALYHKHHLPNYGIFDEHRYFIRGNGSPCILTLNGYHIGVCICEDLWHEGPVEQLIAARVDLILSLNASPFDTDKYSRRVKIIETYAQQGVAFVYVNLVGGQDELVFDGQSMAFDATGKLAARAPAFIEHLHRITLQGKQLTAEITPLLSREALIYQALICGLHDYVQKNGFSGVLLGLSGGIDSALILAIAVDALGASRVHAVRMPSRYTAVMSEQDALTQLQTLNVTHTDLPIEPAFHALLTTLAPTFAGLPDDITEENLQARIRGLLLMALSNKTGKMVLTTSNKSETAVGYATLYGDMNGGFAVLKDVLKTTVYALARYRNSLSPVIPERVLTRPPSAELAPNQTDQDSLPDYALLDAIIQHYMDEHLDANAIIQLGYPAKTVLRVIQLIKRNEYKRRQAAPGVKITLCAFGRDWRYPITSGL